MLNLNVLKKNGPISRITNNCSNLTKIHWWELDIKEKHDFKES